MLLWTNDFRSIFWVVVIPAGLAVALLVLVLGVLGVLGVQEPDAKPGATPGTKRSNPIHRENLKRLGAPYTNPDG